MRSWFEHRVHPIGTLRRFALAFAGVALIGIVFHSWVAIGLVSRGDDLIRSSLPERAIVYFQRAARFDRDWQVPLERFGFAVTLLGNRGWYRSEVEIASRYLEHHPHDAKIRWDRAVAYMHLEMRDAAYRDIAILARAHPEDRAMRDVATRLAQRMGIHP